MEYFITPDDFNALIRYGSDHDELCGLDEMEPLDQEDVRKLIEWVNQPEGMEKSIMEIVDSIIDQVSGIKISEAEVSVEPVDLSVRFIEITTKACPTCSKYCSGLSRD
jgi:hypothetical protein